MFVLYLFNWCRKIQKIRQDYLVPNHREYISRLKVI